MPLSDLLTHLIEPNTWLAHAALSAQSAPHPANVPYVGRFAPSPSGLLHQGSLIAALASYLHACWHRGSWLVRIEDVDTSRCTQAFAQAQLRILHDLKFVFDPAVVWQSERTQAYQTAFEQLRKLALVYPCACTRKDTQPQHDWLHCQERQKSQPIHSWRFKVGHEPIVWQNSDVEMRETLSATCGDFVIKRMPNEWTYQLAVVLDDAAQNISHVVRGEDLLDSTARQIALQQALDLPRPMYSHFPLLLNSDGSKLSKSDQAPALSSLNGLQSLLHAWCFLGGKPFDAQTVDDFWQQILL